ncbi:hypothetical protein GCM10011297_20250 [Bacterioplanes sanyensis]|uniref:hypothetical protein n=1 Tax=Bacterioplanes sanyensis TaxID=1249553 RepID=UPI00167684CA|nr:hypothetical protein [Bacterioplanes sanyensis]GGY47438.1 hypothetical protein GCM10011297_20250 [Bacterioplanes sanyensis]
MKALAQWAMSGRTQATVVAGVALAVPLAFWVGAAIIALVILRQGLSEGSQVLMWASLPAITWLAMGDPTPLLTALGTALSALVLRNAIRLDWAISATVLFGIGVYVSLPLLMSEVMPLVVSNSEAAVAEALKSQPEALAQVTPFVAPLISGGLAALFVLIINLCLLLGRYWQSALYNPAGFGTEFKQLRLPAAVAVPSVLVLLMAGQLQPQFAGLVPILTVPLFLAGLALIHGAVAKTAASPIWLTVTYLSLLFFGPYMYTLLIFVALLDSLMDIRARLKDTASDD